MCTMLANKFQTTWKLFYPRGDLMCYNIISKEDFYVAIFVFICLAIHMLSIAKV